MDARNSIANDLFYKVRSRFTGLKLGTETGAITINPEEARFFDFDYKDGEVPMGHVTISLAEPNSMKVYFSSGITESMESDQKKKWYSFLKELREFAKRRLMAFDTRDIAKDNLDRRDFEFLTTVNKPVPAKDTLLKPVGESVMNESQLYGTKTVSYQKLMDTRLIIKHSHAVMDDTQPGARSRNISALFVENQDGERFKYPFIHLAGARAMQRHVANGGLPYDEIGKSIIGMSEQIAQLRSFNNYVVRNDLMNSETNSIVERSSQALNNLREQVARLSKQSHYEQYKESFQAQQALEVPEEVIEDFTNKFTVRNFKEDLKTVFPILYRLMQEDSIVEYDDIVAMTTENFNDEAEVDLEEDQDELANFENWIMGLGESSPIQSNEEQLMAIENLNKLVAQAFPAGVDGVNAIESLKGIIDDPKLYKEIKDSSRQNPQEDIRPLIQAWIQENAPEVESQIDFGDLQSAVTVTPADQTAAVAAPPATESIVKEDGVDTFVIPNPEYDPNDEDSPEEIEVEVEWTTEGDYYPASFSDPASYPDVVLVSVKNTETGEEIKDKLDGKSESALLNMIDEKEQESGYGDDWYDDSDEYHGESSEKSQKLNTQELAEFIQSFYDRESGTFPKGPEGVCTMVGKKFGKQAESVARKFVERMAPQQTTDNNPELQELARIKELAGMKNESSIDWKSDDVKEVEAMGQTFFVKDTPEGKLLLGDDIEGYFYADSNGREREGSITFVVNLDTGDILKWPDDWSQFSGYLDSNEVEDYVKDVVKEVKAKTGKKESAIHKGNTGNVSEDFEDKTDEIMDWHDKFRRYRGRNGDPLSIGMLLSLFDTGIISDGWEENEYIEAAKQLGKEEEDWDDSDYERALEYMPITNAAGEELAKILGRDVGEDEAEEVYQIINSREESASPELEDIRRLSGIAQGLGF